MKESKEPDGEVKRQTVGVIMPISSFDGCSEQHWIEVREIIYECIKEAGYEPNLVSNADDVGIIQKRIIQNIYSNLLIICDVSGKNPNVMFELGMRLAFDKPTIIIKDDKTTYSFDTSPIEHLEYPRDLRFTRIINFRKSLIEKMKATIQKAIDDPSYTTFLKNFGKFTVAKLETSEVTKDEFILEELAGIRRQLQKMRNRTMQSDLFDNEKQNSLHRMSPDECRDKIKMAAEIIIMQLKKEGYSIRNTLNIKFIISKGKEMGALPDCFSESNNECIHSMHRAIDELKIFEVTNVL